jgi:6-pyruvoyltetrahydropterin/6-carboxytetrahydropterin synthase
MYCLGLKKDLIASHYLIGTAAGPENLPHAHHYTVEVILSGERLNPHGYLIDLDALSPLLESCLGRYRDRLLNELPEFKDRNPSIEAFAQILWQALAQALPAAQGQVLEIKVWETDQAWAAFRKPVG